MTALFLVATFALPIAMLLACIPRASRNRMATLLGWAPVPALCAALQGSGGPPLVVPFALLRMTFVLDRPGTILLGTAALLWIAGGVSAATDLRNRPDAGAFAVFWLLTLLGSLGVFVAADMASFFLAYTVVSLAAYGLVMHKDTPRTQRAGRIYVTLALAGETFLLMALILLAANTPPDHLLIRDVVAMVPTSPWHGATLMMLIIGFGLKIGLVPLHVWMPLTYRAAPIPAAAVLSGAAVKAGVIGLIRFLPFDVPLPGWGGLLVAMGLLGAFYGVAVGITQRHPKTVLAYSSISQMGVIAAILGMALRAGDGSAVVLVAFYAAHHVLVKGGLFLAVGVAAETGARRWPTRVLLPAAIIALGLGGLPLTGGALAKLAVKPPLGDGMVSTLAALSAAGTVLLMLHFLQCLRRFVAPIPDAVPRPGLAWPWFATAFAAVAVPWALYPLFTGGSLADLASISVLWSALWPVLLGGTLAVALRRWENRLPRLPAGDILALGDILGRAAARCGAAVERSDYLLRQWPVAGLSLLTIAIVLGVAMLAKW